MTHRIKRVPYWLAVLTTLFALLLISLAGCQSDRGTWQVTTASSATKQTTQTDTTTASTTATTSGGSETTATTAAAPGEITFPFPASDFTPAVFDRGQYRFQDVTTAELDDYLNQLVRVGFYLQRYDYRCYLQKENILSTFPTTQKH